MNRWKGFCLAVAVLLISMIAMGARTGCNKAPISPERDRSRNAEGRQAASARSHCELPTRAIGLCFHTHRFPVTVYVLEGAFTMEMEGREPVTAKAGQAMMMPTDVKMTGYNRSSTDALRLVVFYVSDPDTPFLDPIH